MIELTTKDLQLLIADVADGTIVPVEIQINNKTLGIDDVKINTIRRIARTENGVAVPKTESKLVITVSETT